MTAMDRLQDAAASVDAKVTVDRRPLFNGGLNAYPHVIVTLADGKTEFQTVRPTERQCAEDGLKWLERVVR